MDPNARVRLLLSELERLRAAYGERLSAAERSALGAVMGDLVGAVGGPGSALRHRDDAQADRDAGLEDDAHGAPGHASADRPSDEPDRRHGHGRSDDGVAEASDHFSAADDPNASLMDGLSDDLGQGEGWIPSRDPDAPYAAEAAQIRAAIDGGPEDRRRLAAGANLCPAAVGALFASKDIAALRILAANTEAHLSAPAVARLARWAKIDPDLAAAFIDRPDLTPALLTQLFFDLRSRLRRRILARARSVRLPQEEIEPIFSAPAPDAQPQSPTGGERRRPPVYPASICEVDGRDPDRGRRPQDLCDQDLPVLVRVGRRNEFMRRFSTRTALSEPVATEILADETWRSAALACRAAQMEPRNFTALVEALEADAAEWRGVDAAADNATPSAASVMVKLYPRLPVVAAADMMRFWRAAR